MTLLLRTEDARSVAGTALTGTLANVGAVTSNSSGTIAIFNGCNQEVVVSWDGGTTSGFIMPASSAFAVDGASNSEGNQKTPKLPVGAQFQAKHNGTVPTSGTLSITVVY